MNTAKDLDLDCANYYRELFHDLVPTIMESCFLEVKRKWVVNLKASKVWEPVAQKALRSSNIYIVRVTCTIIYKYLSKGNVTSNWTILECVYIKMKHASETLSVLLAKSFLPFSCWTLILFRHLDFWLTFDKAAFLQNDSK